jgi:hypothetical protein
MTALLTTDMPPQMEAAANPARMLNRGDFFIISLSCHSTSHLNSTMDGLAEIIFSNGL